MRRFSVLLATVLVSGGCNLQTNSLVVKLFGPPTLSMAETYAGTGSGAVFDHGALDQLLSEHVHGHSVDYEGLAEDAAVLDAYLIELGEVDFDALDRDGKLALLINAYNAFTLRLILDHRPLDSIQDIPKGERWDAVRWRLGGRAVSLTQLEHEELRANFVEPRVHFAINCASVGCPPLRNEAYVPERLEAQLEEQAQQMHDAERWVRIEGDTVYLTPLYLWYQSDFDAVSDGPVAYAARYRPELAEGSFRVEWLDYDWSLNGTR